MTEPSKSDVEQIEDPLDELVRAAFAARRASAGGAPSSVFDSLSGVEAANIRVRLPLPDDMGGGGGENTKSIPAHRSSRPRRTRPGATRSLASWRAVGSASSCARAIRSWVATSL